MKEPTPDKPPWGEGIRVSGGSLADYPELDEIMEQIHQERKLVRRDPCSGDSNPMSSQRPMSDEERAELERVYQERGCGTECDS